MEIVTSRFGRLEVDVDTVIRFPAGLTGLDDCREWVLLADEENDALAWLQSMDRPELALAVVHPRRFVPDYQVRIPQRELALLELKDMMAVRVLAIVGKTDLGMTLNLRAPLLISSERGLGRQVIVNGDLPIQHGLVDGPSTLRRSA